MNDVTTNSPIVCKKKATHKNSVHKYLHTKNKGKKILAHCARTNGFFCIMYENLHNETLGNVCLVFLTKIPLERFFC